MPIFSLIRCLTAVIAIGTAASISAQGGHLMKLQDGSAFTEHQQKLAIEYFTALDPEMDYSFDGPLVKARSQDPIEGIQMAAGLSQHLGVPVILLPPGHALPSEETRSP